MPMIRLRLNEVLALTDTGMEALKSRRRRGEVAIGLGGCELLASGCYAPIDCVAILLATALTEVYGAKVAGQLVRGFADVVLTTIGEAEADRAHDVMLAVIDCVDADGKRAFLASAAHDAGAGAPNGYTVERINAVNVSQIIRAVRASAVRFRIDLNDVFMPAPVSETFAAIMAPFAEMPGGIVAARDLRRRETAARRAGEASRAIAMGGAGRRKVAERAQEVSATAA